jgi:hypothetical protein
MPKKSQPDRSVFEGVALTRRGLAGIAGAAAFGEAAEAQQQPRPAPPPAPAIVPGQAFAIGADAAPGSVIGTLAVTGPPATGFAITGGNPGGIAISDLGTLSLEAPLAPGAHVLSIVARGERGNAAAQRVTVTVTAPERYRPIASVVLEGTGAPAGTVTSFAMPFAAGDVPEGARIVVQHGRSTLASQATVLRRHPDRSARHVLIAVEQPGALRDGERLEARIAIGAAEPEPPADLDMAALLQGRQASVTIRPLRGGAPWVCDLIANLPVIRWVRGPLLSEARVQVDVPPSAVGGATSLRLFADLTLHRDGALAIVLALRNDVGFVRTSGTARYGVVLRQDGRVTLEIPEVTHALYANLLRLSIPATLPGGALAPARPHVRHDYEYLTGKVRFVAHFDRRLGLHPSIEPEFRQRMQRPDWRDHPFPGRAMSQGMGAPGVRDDMGPITRAQAHWLMDGHRTYKAFALDQAEASAGCNWHIWDPTGGPTREGSWLNVLDRPIWADGRDRGFFPTTEPGTTPWEITASHMPSCHFIPYVLTGTRALLDALLAQAAWSMANFSTGQVHRGEGWDVATGEGMIVNRGGQWREHGWRFREILNAGWICPPSEEPRPGYFDTIARGNLNFLNSRIPAYERESGEIYGHFRDSYGLGTPQDVYSYHTEYQLSSLIKAAWFGVPGAEEFVRWGLNWHAGRFLQAPVFHASVFVRLAIPFPYFNIKSWAQLEAAQRPSLGPLPVQNWNLTGEASFDCLPFIAMNIATLVDLFPDDPRVARAWRWFQRPNVPDLPSLSAPGLTTAYSGRSVTPIGRTRAPVPPVLPPGQVFRVKEDHAPGTPVAVLRSRGGLATGYAILGGSSPGRFEVDDAGVITLVDVLSHAEAPRHVLTLAASNAHGRSAPVAIVIEVERADLRAPTIAAVPALEIAANARTGYVLGTLTLAGSPARLSIEDGDRDGRFALDAFGRISVARPLTGLAGRRFDLTVQARNGAGVARRAVVLTVVPPQAAPLLEPAQFDVVEATAPGAVVGRIANRGGPARFTLTGGGDNCFAIAEESGEIRVARMFSRFEAERHALTVAATNATGTAEGRVAITVLPARYVHGVPGLRHSAALGMRRLRENYAGPLLRAARPDGAELDIGLAGPDGRMDMRALVGFARGGPTEVAVWYDQSPLAAHWEAQDAAHRPLLTDAGGLPFRIGALPALRFRHNRGLLTPFLSFPGPRSLAAMVVFQREAAGGTPHLLAFHGRLTDAGDTARLRLLPDGRVSFEQWGNVGNMVSAAPVPVGAPVVLGAVYRGFGAENQLLWVNGDTAQGSAHGLTYEFGRGGLARLGHNAPASSPDSALDGMIAEFYFTEGEGLAAPALDMMGRALAAAVRG